ncbi:MAG: hypothetical protein JW772_03645 [Candidatus Diapherotrites archaeon]|nr:hypothetical protein [Candidatus Diapherotrites archaeon]
MDSQDYLESMAKRKKRSPIPRGRARVLPARKPPKTQHPWMKTGVMTQPTRAIEEYAKQFKGKTMSTVTAIVKHLRLSRKFRRVRMDRRGLEAHYAKRTADEIIRSGVIISATKADIEARRESVLGCVDYCNVLVSVLRLKGIPAVFAREGNHSYVIAEVGGKIVKADPLYQEVEEMTSEKIREIEGKRQTGGAAYGADSHAIGLRSLADFRKYIAIDPPRRER